ncbi:Fc.00g109990.m01.CDS01 [Cosmosporella sp. VM-42]
MDPRFPVTREDLYNLQMEVKQVQYAQSNHAERLLRLEKRQADDAALKSVWNSPFPGVLGGTPQQGPVQIPHNEIFDDLDEQGEQLLGSLHLGPAEEEPVRRGAASRANSVRFDESALHGSSWGGQNSRHSGDFGPVRPGSSLMMERSLSHKSDGRHSSAGHSVHSHHSVASGRASSLGLDTNFAVGDDDDDSFEIPAPPPSFFVLGTVPSIVRCWLTTNFGHATLLYADVCTGSQKSTVDFSLLRELDLLDEIHHDVDGALRVRLNVYFAEAVVTHHGNRAGSPRGPVPSITVYFEVAGADRPAQGVDRKVIRIYLGSDALRAHSADVLFSQNKMTLYGDERDRLQVPFVRPEDDAVFRNICTANMIPEKHKLNANAAPFILGEPGEASQEGVDSLISNAQPDDSSHDAMSPMATPSEASKPAEPSSNVSEAGGESDKPVRDPCGSESGSKGERRGSGTSERARRGSSTAIWGSWRSNGTDSPRETGLSGYQPAGRGSRNMKVLKPLKSGSTSARAGALYEPPLPPKGSLEARRKSQSNFGAENGITNGKGWDTKRTASISANINSEPKQQVAATREARNSQTLPRSANPVGVASAFSWMTPSSKPKTTTAGMD